MKNILKTVTSSAPLIVLLAIVGCAEAADGTDDTDSDSSGDADTDTDGDSDTDSDTDTDGVSQPTPDGRVLVAASSWGGQINADAYITIDFYDGPMRMDAFSAYPPGLHQIAVRAGDCVLYTASDAACDPLCDYDQYCTANHTCSVAPARLNAGPVTVAAGGTTITADPSTDAFMPGYYYADPIPAALVNSDTSFSASAIGGTFPAFSLETIGVDLLNFSIDAQNNSLVLVDGEDNEITWDAASADPDSTVQLVINHGWHGSPPEAVLFCETPATEGVLVIPQAVVEATPVIGGIALMQHGSHISVNRTETAAVGDYTMEFTVSQRAGLNVEHNAPQM